MDLSDLDKAKPNQLKQNRITNIPDYKIDTSDIDSPHHVKFVSKRNNNPLEPQYVMETKSRRHVLTMGPVEGSKPKQTKSVVTRRYTNAIDDIKGTHPSLLGTAPKSIVGEDGRVSPSQMSSPSRPPLGPQYGPRKDSYTIEPMTAQVDPYLAQRVSPSRAYATNATADDRKSQRMARPDASRNYATGAATGPDLRSRRGII